MKIIVMHLASAKHRMKSFRENYPKDLPDFSIHYAKSGAETGKPEWWQFSENLWSNAVNFMDIWESHLNITEPLLIFEDDAKPIPSFKEDFERFLKHVPDDWDVLYLGGGHTDNKHAPPVEVNDHVLRCRSLWGTWAVVYAPKAIPVLLDFYREPNWGCMHVPERRMAQLTMSGRLKAYQPRKFIVGTCGGASLLDPTRIDLEFAPLNNFHYISRHGEKIDAQTGEEHVPPANSSPRASAAEPEQVPTDEV